MASDGKHNPSSMLSAIQSVLALLISYCLFIMANGLFITLLGVRTSIEGFSPGIAGVIVACYFSGLFLGARYAVRFVRIAGYIRAFAGFASVMSISALLHVIWIDPYAWMLIRMLAGFCMAGMIMITESWLNQRASNEMRGQLLSLYMITNYLGGGVGQFLLPLADPSQFQLFSLVSIIFSAALLPILLTRAEAPPSPKVGPVNLRQLIRLSPVGVFGTFCVGWVSASNNGLGPLFAHAAGMSLGDTSIFMFCLIFSGLLLQYPVGRLSDRFDRRGVLFLVTFVTVCMASMMVLAIRYIDSYGMLPIFAICVFYGSTFYTLYSISTSHIADHAAAAEVSMVNVASSVLVVYAAGGDYRPDYLGANDATHRPQRFVY